MSADAGQERRADNISLSDEDSVRRVLADSVLGLWDVVNNLTRLRPSRRDRYRVTIFGSARATPGSFGYEETRRATAMLAAMGCDIVTGGGPGLMQAANEGASTAPERARSSARPWIPPRHPPRTARPSARLRPRISGRRSSTTASCSRICSTLRIP